MSVRYVEKSYEELEAEIAKLKRERDQFKAGHIRYRTLYRAECDNIDTLVIKHDQARLDLDNMTKAYDKVLLLLRDAILAG